MSYTANPIPKASFTTNSCSMVLAIYYYYYYYFFMRNSLKLWDNGTTPEEQNLDAYIPPLSRHRINRKMPQLGVESKTFGLTISLGTLSYQWDNLGGGVLLLVNYTHPVVLNSKPHPPPSTCKGRRFQSS